MQFVASSIIEPDALWGLHPSRDLGGPERCSRKSNHRERASRRLPGSGADCRKFSYVAKDNSADQLRIFEGDYVLCVPYERARGGQLHDKDIVVIERVRSGGAFERTLKQIILKNSTCSLVARSSEPRYPSVAINAQTMTEKDGTIVRVVGLAIAVVTPLPTD